MKTVIGLWTHHNQLFKEVGSYSNGAGVGSFAYNGYWGGIDVTIGFRVVLIP